MLCRDANRLMKEKEVTTHPLPNAATGGRPENVLNAIGNWGMPSHNANNAGGGVRTTTDTLIMQHSSAAQENMITSN